MAAAGGRALVTSPPHLQPPGEPESVAARRVLVLAPHFDDEVLGCGGLLKQLSGAGADIHVLFLSDGGRGRRVPDEKPLPGAPATREQRIEASTFSRERENESRRAGSVLGIRSYEQLALPDGELSLHRADIERAVETALEESGCDLLLLPSPLETSPDHRAAFAATYEVLAPRRVDGPRVLLYEVNHPLYPNLLVDVSDEAGDVERALSLFESQRAQHDYARAGMALRRYRTLTLSPDIGAAEAYRRLDVQDFSTRSLAQLIRFVGGVPELAEDAAGPEISVVIRTKDRPRKLGEALESLTSSTYRRVELVLVNDGGAPAVVPQGFPFPVTYIPLAETRGRATAAQTGVEAASGAYVTFLDDDDLAAPEHLATLAAESSVTRSPVVYSDAAVGTYVEAPGLGWRCRERSIPYSRDFDPDLLVVDNYIPFITLLIERDLFAEVGAFDESLPIFEDWDFLIRLSRHVSFEHVRRVTCEYRQFEGSGEHVLAGESWKQADFITMKSRVLHKHRRLLTPERLSAAVRTLRLEAVRSNVEAADARKALESLRQAHTALEARYHRINGRILSLETLLREQTSQRVRDGWAPETQDLEGEEEGAREHDREAGIGRSARARRPRPH